MECELGQGKRGKRNLNNYADARNTIQAVSAVYWHANGTLLCVCALQLMVSIKLVQFACVAIEDNR